MVGRANISPTLIFIPFLAAKPTTLIVLSELPPNSKKPLLIPTLSLLCQIGNK
jgi:hypothetical protein